MPSDHDKYAQDYDRQIKAYDCYLAEVIFGLCYEGIGEGQRLLDIGIGTGLSSKLFRKAGLHIVGLDSSQEMLEICRKKNIAEELTKQDLLDVPWLYPDSSMDHVISCGVFHFMGELEIIFSEVRRVQKSNGIFAFTTMNGEGSWEAGQRYDRHVEDGISIFAHSPEYTNQVLRTYHYEKEREITCFVGKTSFRVLCSRKCEA